jgi:hypothetical protein
VLYGVCKARIVFYFENFLGTFFYPETAKPADKNREELKVLK